MSSIARFCHFLVKGSLGEALGLGAEARLEVLAVSEQGSALLLRWQDFRALVPAGVPPGEIQRESLTNQM